MQVSGQYSIFASREAVWQALNDPEVIKACLPGCERYEPLNDREAAVSVTHKIGIVKVTLSGHIHNTLGEAPYVVHLTGQGSGALGAAKGKAHITLTGNDTSQTILTYSMNADVTGKMTQLGAKVLNKATHAMVDDFFEALKAHVKGNFQASPPEVAEALRQSKAKQQAAAQAQADQQAAHAQSIKANRQASPLPGSLTAEKQASAPSDQKSDRFWVWLVIFAAAIFGMLWWYGN